MKAFSKTNPEGHLVPVSLKHLSMFFYFKSCRAPKHNISLGTISKLNVGSANVSQTNDIPP